MNLYLKNGYLDMQSIIESAYPFIFIAAARGTGKTYGALKYFYTKSKTIIQLRRTQVETDLQSVPDGTSYKKVLEDLGFIEYSIKKHQRYSVLTDQDGFQVCYNMALSTFASVRGIDFSHIDHVFYDEFITEPHVKKIKNEGMALANFYESVNRNRELEGRKPLQLVCAANSVNMANDVFMYFDLIRDAEEMVNTGEDIRILGNKLLIIPQSSPVSQKKKKTALYAAVNPEFTEMAINNKFILNDQTYVKKRPISEYRCVAQIGILYLYEHKSERTYYISQQQGKTKNVFQDSYSGLEKARRSLYRLIARYLDGYIMFDSYQSVALFEKYFDIL